MYPDSALDRAVAMRLAATAGQPISRIGVTPQSLVQLAAALLSENSAQAVEPGWIRRPALRSPSPTEIANHDAHPGGHQRGGIRPCATPINQTAETAALSGLQRPPLNFQLNEPIVKKMVNNKKMVTNAHSLHRVGCNLFQIRDNPARRPEARSFRSLLM